MSVQAIDWALRLVKNVTPTQKLILICLANHAGPDGTCWPSQTVVSDYSGLSREAVNRNIKELESLGLIETERKKDPDGRETTKRYRLRMADSLGVIPNHTGGSEMRGRCDPESHLTNSTIREDGKDQSPELTGCDPRSHRCAGESQGSVILDHSDCDPRSHKSLRKEPSKEETETKDLKTFAPIDFSASEKSSKPEPEPDGKSPKAPDNETLLPHRRIRMDPKTVRWTGILPDDIDRWKETWPAVDVEQQLREMEVWASAHRSQWKQNWLRFIVHWLSKEQDKGGVQRPISPRSGTTPKTFEEVRWEKNEQARKEFLRKHGIDADKEGESHGTLTI